MDDKKSIKKKLGATFIDIRMGGELDKKVILQSVAEVLTTPIQVVWIIIVSLNANILEMRNDILEWEATHVLEKVPLNPNIIGSRYIKDGIHTIVNYAHAKLVLVGPGGYNLPLVLWVRQVSAIIFGSWCFGLYLILGANGKKCTRVNRNLGFVWGRILGVR